MTTFQSNPVGLRRPLSAPVWAKLAAALAVVALIGGWTLAAVLQPPGFSSIGSTISALSAQTARYSWVMTAALALTGIALLVVAAGLSPVPPPARMCIALGGLGVLVVAAAPLPYYGVLHTWAATVTFSVLAVWPVLAIDKAHGLTGQAARRSVQVTVACVLLVVLLEVRPGVGGFGGLVERILTGGEVAWIAAVTVCAGDQW